jgi:hypothetical protein
MRQILTRRNQDLRRTVTTLHQALAAATVPCELEPYRARALQLCEYAGAVVDDLLSNTRLATQSVQLVSSQLAVPILRASPSDRLCLATIGWLHRTHPEASSFPPVCSDGPPSIHPFLAISPFYFFPSLERGSLLYQALFFHEFGHLLYAYYRQEMDDLVNELRRDVGYALVPASQRNDRYAREQAAQRQAIVNTWYSWAQEFFCDAVGLTIGGPCYLYAFSAYLKTMDRSNFYREQRALRGSAHPVTWLRMKFLATRAVACGYIDAAREVAEDWAAIAGSLNVQEDYHGFYDVGLAAVVERTIDDMLTVASPRACTAEEAAGGRWSAENDTPVRLFNSAWQVYRTTPDTYGSWETAQVEALLQ